MSAPAFLTETRERFLKAVLAQLPIERIRELYLFQPIKQGGVESGVAVIAAWPEGFDPSAVGRSPSSDTSESQPVAATEGPQGGVGQDAAELTTVELEAVVGEAAEANACELPAGDAVAAANADAEAEADGTADAEPLESGATVDSEAVADDGEQPTDDVVALDGEEPTDNVATAPPEKYTVYTARYRHVLKGPDRGKWEASVVAEADAPLISIETVVRGVQRRAGDVEGPDHMTAGDVRAALRLAPAASDAA